MAACQLLDWRNLEEVPTSTFGAEKLAVLVNSHPLLRAATVFAEQAGMQGVLVRVFTQETEAMAWLDRRRPSAAHPLP